MSTTTKFNLNVIVDSYDAERHDVTVHAKDQYGVTLKMVAHTYDKTERHKAVEALVTEVTHQLITEGY